MFFGLTAFAAFMFGWPACAYLIADKLKLPDWTIIALWIIPVLTVCYITLEITTTR